MKKILTIVLAVFAFGISESNAQEYELAAGLGVSFSSNLTMFGPSGKYFISDDGAIQADLLFGTGVTMINGIYTYNAPIGGANGLNWYAGGGMSFLFVSNGGGTNIALRAMGGLEYVIEGAPLALTFDWRPFIGLGKSIANEIGSFGLGIRYIIQ